MSKWLVNDTKIPDELKPYQYIVIVDSYDEVNLGTVGTLAHCKQWIKDYASDDPEEINCYMIYELRAKVLAQLKDGSKKSA